MNKDKQRKNFEEEFAFAMDVCRAFGGMLLGASIGTVAIFEGAWWGAVFYIVAAYSAGWLAVLLFKAKCRRGDNNEHTD